MGMALVDRFDEVPFFVLNYWHCRRIVGAIRDANTQRLGKRACECSCAAGSGLEGLEVTGYVYAIRHEVIACV